MILAVARIHDLLRLRPETALIGEAPAPGWVPASLSEAPWVVVRSIRSDAIGVRVRGAAPGQRFDALTHPSAIAYRSTPEDLAGRRREPWRAAQSPALAALGRVDPVLTRFAHPWGPIGSVAFELATGLPATTPACDLDLVLRREEPLAPHQARALLRDLVEAAAPVRVDLRVETRLGYVALGDLAVRRDRILVKSSSGYRLLSDPWQEAA